MSPNLYRAQSENVKKTWILMSAFFLIIMALGWFASLYYGMAIFYFAVFFSIFMNIFSYWNSHKLVLKISGAKPVKRSEYFDLYNSVENLAITAGLPMPKVYVINDPAPNAFATGRNKDHAVIAVTSGLLEILDKTELDGVIAHEMSHIGNRDILLQTVVVTLVGLIALLADLFWRFSFLRGGRRNGGRGGGGGGGPQAVLMIVGIALMILSPIVASMIQLSISRKREYLADSSGSLLTRYPEGLASALEKISNFDGKMIKANHAMAHLYISDPYGANLKSKQKKDGWFKRMFMTHPPIENRISKLRGVEIK